MKGRTSYWRSRGGKKKAFSSLVSLYICCDVFISYLMLNFFGQRKNLWVSAEPHRHLKPALWLDVWGVCAQTQFFPYLCPAACWVQRTAAVIRQGLGNEKPRCPLRKAGLHVNQGSMQPTHALLSHHSLLTQHILKDKIVKKFKMATNGHKHSSKWLRGPKWLLRVQAHGANSRIRSNIIVGKGQNIYRKWGNLSMCGGREYMGNLCTFCLILLWT